MAVCSKCGSNNPPDANACGACGHLFARANPLLGATMLGMPTPSYSAPGMLQAEPTDTTDPAPPERVVLAVNPLLKATLVGMRAPILTAAASSDVVGGGSLPANAPSLRGTLLGIARPGIAPSHDGVRPGASGQSFPPAPPISRAPLATPRLATAPSEPPRVSSKPPTRQRGHGRTVALALGAIAFAAAIGGLVAVVAPQPVRVLVKEFAVDENGQDQLTVTCLGCPTGSRLVLGDLEARVESEVARFAPRAPFSIGDNQLSFELRNADGSSQAARPVVLPVAFRVRTNWDERHSLVPAAQIVVLAPDGTLVDMNEKRVPLVAGRATFSLPFEAETSGETREVTYASASIPIRVTVSGTQKHTVAAVRSGIAPLTLFAPGPRHRAGGKDLTLTGLSAPLANISAGGRSATADARGYFVLNVGIPAPGVLVVTAQVPELLKRRVAVNIENISAQPADAVTRFDQFRSGLTAHISANVIESRVADGTTSVLLEVHSGCSTPPCLLRALYAEPRAVAPNRELAILGTLVAGDPMTIRVQSIR